MNEFILDLQDFVFLKKLLPFLAYTAYQTPFTLISAIFANYKISIMFIVMRAFHFLDLKPIRIFYHFW